MRWRRSCACGAARSLGRLPRDAAGIVKPCCAPEPNSRRACSRQRRRRRHGGHERAPRVLRRELGSPDVRSPASRRTCAPTRQGGGDHRHATPRARQSRSARPRDPHMERSAAHVGRHDAVAGPRDASSALLSSTRRRGGRRVVRRRRDRTHSRRSRRRSTSAPAGSWRSRRGSMRQGDPPESNVTLRAGRSGGSVARCGLLGSVDEDARQLDRVNRLVRKLPPGDPSRYRDVGLLVIRPSADPRLACVPESRSRTPCGFSPAAGPHARGRSRNLLSVVLVDRSYIGRLLDSANATARRAATRSRSSSPVDGGQAHRVASAGHQSPRIKEPATCADS